MKDSIRNRIGLRQVKKQVHQHTRYRKLTAFDEARTFLLAYARQQTEQEIKYIEHFAETLAKAGKKVLRLVYMGKMKKKEPRPADTDSLFHLYSEDFSLIGLPQSPKARKLLNEPCDYLINLNPEGKTALLSFSAFSHAGMRIGFYSDRNLPYFDLLLGNKSNSDLSQYIRDIDHYIRQLKK
jgi:hypothetical protein